ncbi:head maturation protease, ClpP-related [Pararhizobium haloflavum]|uniref:head maturation protease, ClpP-related n=1 Tax=Pararhizobium haloflavum TaxID=2037914 RepID=UPI000C194524|nr:head maturation protease, ClpP-related [Pararhizobium haloflavum]
MSVLIDGELVLYGFVGDDFWGEGFNALDVVEALATLGRSTDVTVRINSGGGYTDDGVAIFNALTAHKGKVTIIVDAIAASAASIIVMAGDERIMREGAMLMIHDPAMVTFGDAADHQKSKDQLDRTADLMAAIYADVTGEDVETIRRDMVEEIWLTGQEALDRGFVTEIAEACARATAAFDFRAYAHAPERLVALAKKKNWSLDTGDQCPAASAAPTRRAKEISMTDREKADDKTAETLAKAKADAATEAKTRIKAIMACDEAKGREGLAEHFAYDTEMTAEAAVAALAKAPKAAAGDQPEGKAGPDETADPVAYEQQRLRAAGQAQPGGAKPKAKTDTGVLAAAVTRTNKRR